MKKFLLLVSFLFSFLLGTFSTSLGTNIDLGVSLNNDKITHFYFSLGEYYRVPYDEIIIIKKRYPIIREEELPVFLLIINYARVSPDVIIELRKAGWSWYNIMIHFGLEPERIFQRYIVIYGPPYGRAYGYYKKPPKKIILKDYDLIELSHLKFFSEYYQRDPRIIIELKKKEKNYIIINERLYHEKEGKRDKPFKNNFKNKEFHKHKPNNHFK